jgi:hypothetical protein
MSDYTASVSGSVQITQAADPVISRGFNFSLLKTNTILQGLAGAFITAAVVVSVVVGVAVFSSTVKYDYPEVNPDFATTFKITPVRIYVLENDRDIRQGNLTIKDFTQPLHGTVRVVDNTYFVYTPYQFYSGLDTFNYTAQNDKLTSSTSVTVKIMNHPPEPIAQRYLINKNSKNNKASIFEYENEARIRVSDLDQDILTVVGTTQPTRGVVTFDAQNVYYTPGWNFNGIDTCNYTISDGNDTATHILTFEVFNSPPQANPDFISIIKNNFTVLDVLANDVDINQDPLNITWVGNVQRAQARATQDNQFIEYLPQITGASSADSFEYRITDGSLFDSTYVVLTLINRPPVAQDVSVVVGVSTKDNPIPLTYSDPDTFETLIVALETSQSIGTFTLTPSCVSLTQDYANGELSATYDNCTYSLLYTPPWGRQYTENPTFYTVTDTGKLVARARINIVVMNSPPITPNVTSTCSKRLSTYIDVFSSASDPNGDPITLVGAAAIPGVTRGTVSQFNGTHAFYTAPQDGSRATDVFTYSIRDTPPSIGDAATSTGYVFVSIYNEPPVAVDDPVFVVPKGLSTPVDVLLNDRDPNRDKLFVHSVASSSLGATVAIGSGVRASSGQTVDMAVYSAFNAQYNDTFTYIAKDDEGATSNVATVSIMVKNTPPVAVDDQFVVFWNTSSVLDVIANDTDVNPGDKDILRLAPSTISTPSNGGSAQAKDKSIIYTPVRGFTGTETFTYKVQDEFDSCAAPATVRVTVVNNPPVAVDDVFVKHHLIPSVTFDVLANDFDPQSDPIVLVSVNSPRASIISSNGKQLIQYSSTPGFVGNNTFQYTISDWNKQATASVTVVVVDQAPIAAPDFLSVHWNDTTQKTASVLDNDSDPDNDPISLGSQFTTSTGFVGTLVTAGDTFKYTVPGNAKGVQTVTYQVTDGALNSNGLLTITITNNDVPRPSTDYVSAHWRTQSVGTTITVLTAATDNDGDSLSFTLPSTVSSKGGSVSVVDGSSVLFKHQNFLGNDSFTATISDGLDSAPRVVAVNLFNNAPQAADFNIPLSGNRKLSGILIDVIAKAFDADPADVPFLTIVNAGTSVNAKNITIENGQIRYIPLETFSGPDSFLYTISDGMSTTTANITVQVPNVNPSLQDQFKDVHWSTQFTGSYFNLTSLTLNGIASPPARGSASIYTANNTLFYKQNNGVLGSDYLEVFYVDGGSSQNKIRVYISVFNTLPSATAKSYTAHWRLLLAGIPYDVMQGAFDLDPQDSVSLSGATQGSRGSTTITAPPNSRVSYRAASPYLGTDSFSYSVFDGIESVSRPVTITSTNAHVPNAQNIAYTKHWRLITQTQGDTITVLASATDLDGDTLTITLLSQPSAGGSASVNGLNIFYRHDNWVGVESFQYQISDGISVSTGVITCTITNTAPVAVRDLYTYHWRSASSVQLSPSPLANDTDPNGDPVVITAVGQPALGGSVSVSPSRNQITYNYRSGTVGLDSFTYTISDNYATSSAVINVLLTNTAPTAPPVSVITLWRSAVSYFLLCTDANSDPLTYRLTSNPSQGTVTFTGTGGVYTPTAVSYTLRPDSDGRFKATDTFQYGCSDTVAESSNTVTVTIYNTPPTAVNDVFSFRRNVNDLSPRQLLVLTNDGDSDGDSIRITGFSGTRGQIIALSADSQFLTYTASASFVGTDLVTYTITDGNLQSTAVASVTFTNDAPTCNDITVTIPKGVSQKWYIFQDASCSDINGDVMSISLASIPTNVLGSASTGTDGNGTWISYTPFPNRSGSDRITYTVSDNFGGSNTYSIFIIMPNLSPVAAPPRLIAYDKWPVSRNYTIPVLQGATDPNNDPLTLVRFEGQNCTTGPRAIANYLIQVGNNIIMNIRPNVTGSCAFNYTFHDNDQDDRRFATGFVTALQLTNSPPTAVDDSFTTNQGTAFSVNVQTLLANDFDVNNDSFVFDGLVCRSPGVTCVKTPQLQNQNGQLFFFVPADTDTCGTLRFEYRIRSPADNLTSIGSIFLRYINCQCRTPVDICFLIDGSGSISSQNWINTRNFMNAIVDQFVISPTRVRVSVTQFSTQASFTWDSNRRGFPFMDSSNADVKNRISQLVQYASGTATINGIETMWRICNSTSRPNVAKTVIIFTDGAANDPCSCNQCISRYGNTNACLSPNYPGWNCTNCVWSPNYCMPCADPRPRAQQINAIPLWRTVAIGVGQQLPPVGWEQVVGMAYDPSAAFRIDWNQLNTITQKIVDESC